ncbi:outer membrane receptor for ferrienterochelin and colicin [Novosphingobium kunmingense]|uniref:Outer membrane receptor for ferrienterochelin and colicin n=1 Tax=Novosphingobium kunmingense TaxID=1211806 RepID=A0A2N0H3C0_9SPHN|nr:TonB-dependent receptor [Novosphingobium kunmingense]PKB13433.1 outer membrane receptor for ferrienterochelin and colicin [Novosphingobium kunmingense]
MSVSRDHSASFRSLRAMLLCGIGATLPFAAEAAEVEAVEDEQTRSASEIVVQAEIGYGNRDEDAVEPVLVYDETYFQRFEPLTAGDALKRVPSVTFLSDVIESDGARLRGLEPGYTQILINGDKVPGSQADRSFFLDRIPAELIKQVEIVRSSSARRTGDAVAGSLNIVLRDAFAMDGGYVKAGALFFDDGKTKPNGGFYYGGPLGPGRVLGGVNVQGRYNPKVKKSLRYAAPNGAFVNREDQSDVRNGTDYAGNLSYAIEGETTRFEIAGNYVKTERVEDERSQEYNSLTAVNGPVRATVPGNLLTDNHNVNAIDQESWSVSGKLSKEWSLGETKLKAGFARFDEAQDEFENEIDFDRSTARLTADTFDRRFRDEELSLELSHEVPLSDGLSLAFGGFAQNKDRDTDLRSNDNPSYPRNRVSISNTIRNAYSVANNVPDDYVTSAGTSVAIPGGLNRIAEDRRDLFALVEGGTGALLFEAGLRWENTDVSITDLAAPATIDTDYNYLLPSASLKLQLGDGRITASAARTVRRPRLDYLVPATLEEEYGDNDFLGNPALKPESAWGGDLGYEYRLGRTGVIGVNLFYRRVENLIELATVLDASGNPVPGSANSDPADVDTFVLQPRNAGTGEVWGVEFDLSASLGAFGLRNTGVFGNLSLIDSKVADVFGSRRFNGQSSYVYNFGVIQNLPSVGASFGATYRKQGPAYDRIVGEEIRTTYGADLEVFIEKRFGKSFTIRGVGSNLLNASKDEAFNKFTTIPSQIARDFDEYELETETAGPVFQVVARFAF